ncbi:hypothetical protein VCSRO21_2761 [Vibrio cholerae]|nr:hypothetical protein VCSRO21_2761 [Vibrio cholerae]
MRLGIAKGAVSIEKIIYHNDVKESLGYIKYWYGIHISWLGYTTTI